MQGSSFFPGEFQLRVLSASSASIFSIYSSSFALGGAHCDLGLNGCFCAVVCYYRSGV